VTERWPDSARAILHVDMDAFYASVEQRENPTLLGQPVIVGGPKNTRGVVSAASYEARRFGIHSAMPLRRAGQLCSHGVFLPVRMKLYQEVSKQIFSIFGRFSPQVEPLSVDEAFLDLTGTGRLFGSPIQAARALRTAVKDETGLTASVGVAPSKFVAKIASDFDKPDGLVVVRPGELEAFLQPLPIERMWGVGPRGAASLHEKGIHTFADLAASELTGGAGRKLVDLALGRDSRAVVTSRAPKSIGHETTFMEDTSDGAVVHATLVSLTDRVAQRLRGHGLRARCVTLKVRYAPFRTLTRRRTLEDPTCVTSELLAAVFALFETRLPRTADPVRLLGVSTSQFSAQGLLFESDGVRLQARVDSAVDQVRERFGALALRRGSVLDSV